MLPMYLEFFVGIIQKKSFHFQNLPRLVDILSLSEKLEIFKINKNSHFAIELASGDGLWLFIQHEIVIGE